MFDGIRKLPDDLMEKYQDPEIAKDPPYMRPIRAAKRFHDSVALVRKMVFVSVAFPIGGAVGILLTLYVGFVVASFTTLVLSGTIVLTIVALQIRSRMLYAEAQQIAMEAERGMRVIDLKKFEEEQKQSA